MYPRPNVSETLPSQGDAINKLFAEHYKASLRTAEGILHSREDSEDYLTRTKAGASLSLTKNARIFAGLVVLAFRPTT